MFASTLSPYLRRPAEADFAGTPPDDPHWLVGVVFAIVACVALFLSCCK